MKQIPPKDMVTMQWYLVLCRPNQHHIAKRSLSRLDCEVFMPLQQVQRRWRGRTLKDVRPVFPGYVFVGMDPRRPIWHPVKTAYGVSRMIGFGEHGPAVVPDGIISGLMARCDGEGIMRPLEDSFAVGDRIRIISGPFADFVTEIDKIDAERRLHVLLDILGRRTLVVLAPAVALRRS